MTLTNLLVAATIGFLVWQIVAPRIGLVSIAPGELQRRMEAGESILIIDVREPSEFQQGHLKGARLLPLGTLRTGGQDLPKEKTVVLVCRSGNRSAQAFQMFKRRGYTNLLNLSGGMTAWTGPVVR